MFLDFQISTAILARNFRNYLHHMNLCVPEPIDLEIKEVMVDQIQILDNTSYMREDASISIQVIDTQETIQGTKAVMVQPIQFFLVDVNNLEQNGTAPTGSYFLKPIFDFHFDITASVDNNHACLQLTFRKIELVDNPGAPLPAFIKERINSDNFLYDILEDNVSPITRQIDISTIQDMLPDQQLLVTNAGVIVIADRETLVLRLEINSAPNQKDSWTSFYNTYDKDLTNNNDWALIIDNDLLEQTIKNNLTNQIKSVSDSFSLDREISVNWNPVSDPVFKVSFSGEAIDACNCLFGKMDLNVDISLSITLQVPVINILRFHIQTTYINNSYLEASCCYLTDVIHDFLNNLSDWKFGFGLCILGLLRPPIGFFIGVFAFAVSQSVATDSNQNVAIDSNQSADITTGGQGQCNKVNDETLHCDEPFSLDMGEFGGVYSLNDVSAQPEGPVLAGTSTAIQELQHPKIVVTSNGNFHWGLSGSCARGFKPRLTGGCSFRNDVPGSILELCEVSVIDDPLLIFQSIEVTDNAISVLPELTDEYLAEPYPCKLRIVSNGGVRILTLDSARQITEEERLSLIGQAAKRAGNCLIDFVPPFRIMKYKWLPYPYERDLAQLWHIVVSDMDDQEVIEVIDGSNNIIATASANRLGIAQVSAFFEGDNLNDELAVRISKQDVSKGSAKTKKTNVKRHVSVKQVQLELLSEICPMGYFETMSLSRSGRKNLLTYRTNVGKFVYDINVPNLPSLIKTVSATNAVKSEQQLISRSNLLVHHSSGKLEILNNHMEVITNLECASPKASTVVKNHVYTLNSMGLARVSLTKPQAEEYASIEKEELHETIRIEKARLAGVKEALCLIDKKGNSRIMDVSDHKKPVELGIYFQKPWYVDAERLGKLFVKFSTETGRLMIYRLNQVAEI